jgi:uncharacterized membrane protein YesL
MKSKVPASLRVIGRAVVDWWDSWLDMVLLSLAWIVAQVTIVLGPPATFGLFYVIYEMTNGESMGVKGLIEGAKKYFLQAWLWAGINLLVALILYVNIRFYGEVQAVWGLYLQVFMIVITGLWIATQFYTLPFMMEMQVKKVHLALRNGILTTMAAPLYTLVVLVFAFIVALLGVGLVIPIFLGILGIIPFLGIRAMEERLITFGLKDREKSPKELEFEEGGRIKVQGMDDLTSEESETALTPQNGDLDASDADKEKES